MVRLFIDRMRVSGDRLVSQQHHCAGSGMISEEGEAAHTIASRAWVNKCADYYAALATS